MAILVLLDLLEVKVLQAMLVNEVLKVIMVILVQLELLVYKAILDLKECVDRQVTKVLLVQSVQLVLVHPCSSPKSI
jgi:hypothetical protein